MSLTERLRATWRGPATAVRWVVTHVPVTISGMVVAVVGVASYLAGWLLGWVELLVVAAGCLLALLIAVPFVVGRLRLRVTRTLVPDRVTVGEPALAQLVVANTTARAVGPRILEDRVRGRPVRVEVPGLGAGEQTAAMFDLPTRRRGRYPVGPALVAKADPLGLLRREVVQARSDDLWVHPAHRMLGALPVGFAKDLEGPTTDTSPAGDVSFHTLREYQVGDDYRHIHWLSTARTGTTMIRHYVDNRRPHLAVLLDDRATSYVEEAGNLEVAVEIAASLGVSSMLNNQPVALGFGAEPVLHSRQGREGPDAVLDALTLLEAQPGAPLPEAISALLRREPGTSALVVVTGGIATTALLEAVRTVRRACRVLVVRVWPSRAIEPGTLPGATLFDVDGLDGFAAAWQRITR